MLLFCKDRPEAVQLLLATAAELQAELAKS